MHYNLIVVGGGFAGAAAAISAAREGVKVLLLDKSGFLGGAPGNCYINPFMPYTTKIGGVPTPLSDGIFTEILKRLDKMGGLHQNRSTFSEEILKLVLDDMAEESGVDVLFHAYLSGVEFAGRKVKSVTITGKGGSETFTADYFVDATGDADLTAMAGRPCRIGREGDHLCQPMTLCFRLSNVDVDLAFQNTRKINELYKQFQQAGKIKNPREDVLKMRHVAPGVLHLNSTRVVKRSPFSLTDLSIAEREARRQMFELYQFLKGNCEGFENSVLLSSAPEIGVRESRMIDGLYTLTVEDLKGCVKFDDAIAACNYDIDIHNPEGSGTSHYYFPEGEYYTIPYRSLIPKGADNLLVAGRCISGSHEAQASFRIMPTCCSTGQAAGIAAAVAVQSKKAVPDADIQKIQRLLREKRAFF